MKKIFFIAFLFTSTFAEAQMTQIVVTSVRKYPTYVEGSYKMRFTLPAIFGTGSNPISGLDQIASTYGFSTEIIPITGTVLTYFSTKSFDVGTTQTQIQTFLQDTYTTLRNQIDAFTLTPIDNLVGLKYNGSTWSNTSTITDAPLGGETNSGVTGTAASGSAVTVTIPALTGKFHNITHITITAYSTAARTGSATPITVTSTNLPGSPVWTFATAGAIGTTDIKTIEPTNPIRSSVANTATTIVCPATTGVIWRVQVFYTTI